MMTRHKLPLCLLVWAIFITSAAHAEVQYVTDEFEITMRIGPATDNKIVRMLKSGTAVEILDVDAENGYSRVREPEGEEGWVLTRYLMIERSAREQLADTTERVRALEQETRELKRELMRIPALQSTISSLQGANSALSEELSVIRDTAADTLAINQENETLKQAISTLIREKDTLEKENEALRNDSQQQWFVRGAGVVTLGILIGLVIPRIRWRRRRGWGEL